MELLSNYDDLIDIGLIKQTRKAGNAPMYQINQDNGAAQAFGKFEWEVIKALGESEE